MFRYSHLYCESKSTNINSLWKIIVNKLKITVSIGVDQVNQSFFPSIRIEFGGIAPNLLSAEKMFA